MIYIYIYIYDSYPDVGNFTSQDFDICLRSCCADSSSPQISGIPFCRFTVENNIVKYFLNFIFDSSLFKYMFNIMNTHIYIYIYTTYSKTNRHVL